MFNMFKSQSSLDLSPRNCLAVSLLYCMASDGEIDPEEVGHLMSVLGRNATRQQLDAVLKYMRSTPPDQFLGEVATKLRPEQKLCIVLNMIDSAMSDGEAEPGEERLILQFAQAFGLTESELTPHFRTLVAKNDRAVLDR
ncbi:putative tellurite resistance protein B-like protein [Methylobacterium sp. PvP062]|uniref:Tellurite resistance protein B-like protein n=1 Tax=Methylobacterium radiotolerans TaxID=31998 RepID=A0ABV2NS27_9HYPH|nr:MULTISPECIES: TerB family tellurite resistance protein [unclassified Methylobacterium]MBP2494062.1 putative tellurite resistance protein B-like protein [Methylobacterium sp. PvP105]MBP2499564.1 putative tellurite resistance protein B-like protein [Methylobacterium sp. PvP109]MCX7331691.1 TerB family tellurite resistance protein [Hyphomicrobiales bacterium]